MPANIVSLDAIICWTEPAASAGAQQARRSRLWVTVDAPPYSPLGNGGEWSGILAWSTKGKFTGLSLATFAGQTVRLKVYGESVNGLCRASAYLYWRYQNTETPEPTLSISQSKTVVQPNTTFTMTGAWSAAATGDEFDNARIWPVVPSFAVTQLLRTTADSVPQLYTGATHPSSPWPALGSNGITVGQGNSRSAVWTLRAPAVSSTYTLRVDGQADYRATSTASATSTICVDGLAPNAPVGLTSSTHTVNVWYSNPSITFNWTPGTDNGCAGVIVQMYDITQSSCDTTPFTYQISPTRNTVTESLSSVIQGNGYYFGLRSMDGAGNYGSTACSGPYLIDTIPPTIATVSINRSLAYTASLNVMVEIDAADVHSGLSVMRLSSDNATWSPWQAFTSSVAFDLSSYGGNGSEGMKHVYVQVRDRATNQSATVSDTIEYMRLAAITSSTPASLPNVTEGSFRLTGTDFLGVTQVVFDSITIASTSANSWHLGYFRVVNDTTLDVYPPQAQATGAHTVRLRNAVGTSNAQSVSLEFPRGIVLRTHSQLTAGLPQAVYTSSGPNAGAYVSYLCLSPSMQPSVLPGIVSFQIGNSFASLTVLSTPIPHDPVTRAATIQFATNPSLIRATLHFEAMTFSSFTPPLSTTDVWSTTYN